MNGFLFRVNLFLQSSERLLRFLLLLIEFGHVLAQRINLRSEVLRLSTARIDALVLTLIGGLHLGVACVGVFQCAFGHGQFGLAGSDGFREAIGIQVEQLRLDFIGLFFSFGMFSRQQLQVVRACLQLFHGCFQPALRGLELPAVPFFVRLGAFQFQPRSVSRFGGSLRLLLALVQFRSSRLQLRLRLLQRYSTLAMLCFQSGVFCGCGGDFVGQRARLTCHGEVMVFSRASDDCGSVRAVNIAAQGDCQRVRRKVCGYSAGSRAVLAHRCSPQNDGDGGAMFAGASD